MYVGLVVAENSTPFFSSGNCTAITTSKNLTNIQQRAPPIFGMVAMVLPCHIIIVEIFSYVLTILLTCLDFLVD